MIRKTARKHLVSNPNKYPNVHLTCSCRYGKVLKTRFEIHDPNSKLFAFWSVYQSQRDVKGTRLDHLNYPDVIESHLSVIVLFCPLPPTLPGQTPGHLNYCSTEENRGLQIPVSQVQNRAFSNHVTAAILVFKAAMLVFRTNPVVVELSSHVNVFFCNYKLT